MEKYSNKDLLKLKDKLIALNDLLKINIKNKYARVNPFCENLFSWHDKAKYCGSEKSTIYDSATIIGNVSLGKNLWIGPFCILDGSGGLKIGDFCDISCGVKIFTHDTVKRALTSGKHNVEYGPVNIGSNCFIGTDTVILKNSELGDFCVVATNSVVRGSFTKQSIIAGNPAKKIGKVILDENHAKLVFEN